MLMEKHNFKLKVVGPLSYHLGGIFYCDPDGTLCWGSQTYVKKMLDNYERQFGSLPSKKASSPLENNDHPELDDSAPLMWLGLVCISQ